MTSPVDIDAAIDLYLAQHPEIRHKEVYRRFVKNRDAVKLSQFTRQQARARLRNMNKKARKYELACKSNKRTL